MILAVQLESAQWLTHFPILQVHINSACDASY
jgi:hypothetical protein